MQLYTFLQKILNKLYTANIYSVNLILVQMLVNTTNLEYTCTGLNFSRGDLWYPPRLTQAGHTLQVETSSFLWGEQVHLFSYSRIESESTTTLGTKATNTRLKQQTFQPTETKKSWNLYFITLGAFHSPSGQGVKWFKEGKKFLLKTHSPLSHFP